MLPRAVAIGSWANGKPIDISQVPLVTEHYAQAEFLESHWITVEDGWFNALYHLVSCDKNRQGVYELVSVREVMPPMPPQIQGIRDNVRLPMWWVEDERAQRKYEWEAYLA